MFYVWGETYLYELNSTVKFAILPNAALRDLQIPFLIRAMASAIRFGRGDSQLLDHYSSSQ